MGIIGRKKELLALDTIMNSTHAEFVAVFGRRRIGKTYLIKKYFNNKFAFYATGIANAKLRDELGAFNLSLLEYGSQDKSVPKDWFEAFERLKSIIKSERVYRDPAGGKIVIFLDELPWFASPRSNFKAALDFFWNGFASEISDLVLIVCGSATSWIIDNLLSDRGGFHNRITRQIHLAPFSLRECADYYKDMGFEISNQDLFLSYMVFGGVPYYMSLADRRLSLMQNIDELCFNEYGQLHYEYDRLFSSLFKKAEKHIEIIKELSKRRGGFTRKELAEKNSIGDGEPLTKALEELVQCGFVRKYRDFTKEKSGFIFQLIDPFTLFSLNFIKNSRVESWKTYIDTPKYYSWCGYSFELLVLLHTGEIKRALGISGIEAAAFAWKSKNTAPGAQIDLLVDRADNVINICEIKYSKEPFVIDSNYEKQLTNKLEVFRNETNTKKALHLTFITVNGLKHNAYSGIVVNEISAGELFN